MWEGTQRLGDNNRVDRTVGNRHHTEWDQDFDQRHMANEARSPGRNDADSKQYQQPR